MSERVTMLPQFNWPSQVVEHSESRGYQPNTEADNVAHTILTPEESKVPEEIRDLLYSTLPIRFWVKTELTETCWIWNAAKWPKGYGHFDWQGKNIRVHRLVWSIVFGEIPPNLLVCHKCDNPPCFNPAHLFLGTHFDNNEDSIRKGRSAIKPGECNHAAKLTDEQAYKIKTSLSRGASMISLARRYGVDETTIRRIHRGETWAHIATDKMTGEERRAYEWALTQPFHSVGADYARILAKFIERTNNETAAPSSQPDAV